jgi:DMSO reductase anchor subunit
MKHDTPLVFFVLLLGVSLGSMPALAAPQDTKEKTCRMEQQCHWENFKKVCVYVKVCR